MGLRGSVEELLEETSIDCAVYLRGTVGAVPKELVPDWAETRKRAEDRVRELSEYWGLWQVERALPTEVKCRENSVLDDDAYHIVLDACTAIRVELGDSCA